MPCGSSVGSAVTSSCDSILVSSAVRRFPSLCTLARLIRQGLQDCATQIIKKSISASTDPEEKLPSPGLDRTGDRGYVAQEVCSPMRHCFAAHHLRSALQEAALKMLRSLHSRTRTLRARLFSFEGFGDPSCGILHGWNWQYFHRS